MSNQDRANHIIKELNNNEELISAGIWGVPLSLKQKFDLLQEMKKLAKEYEQLTGNRVPGRDALYT